jgi:hypothetical protein
MDDNPVLYVIKLVVANERQPHFTESFVVDAQLATPQSAAAKFQGYTKHHMRE